MAQLRNGSARKFSRGDLARTCDHVESRQPHRQVTLAASPHQIQTNRDVPTSEHVRCANETGVVGRFQQQIGHVMTCVGSDLDPDMHLYFGDWWDEVSCFCRSFAPRPGQLSIYHWQPCHSMARLTFQDRRPRQAIQ